jgi:hypothetical protein
MDDRRQLSARPAPAITAWTQAGYSILLCAMNSGRVLPLSARGSGHREHVVGVERPE